MIKRYEPMGPNRALLEHPRGRWVRHETFEMFEALTRRLETELGEARAERERLTKELKEARANYEEVLQSRVRAEDDGDAFAAEAVRLRAENERLRVFHQAYTDRIRARAVTIADESFGPFPVLTADDALTEIEQGISKAHIERELLRAENERLRADRDERRADAIYGAAYVAAPVSLTPRQAHAYAEDIVSIWRERAAQKGGSDAGH